MAANFKHELGIKARNLITEFEGTITCRAEYLNGCRRYITTAPYNKGDKEIVEFWADENEIVEIVPPAPPVVEPPKVRTGGPQASSVVSRRV